jgi:S-DNA-T family DNA segregation ATPase FtsK/SpoIIIE
MILIDPKGLEFDPYRNTPHCLDFAETNAELQNTLQTCYQFAKNRYNKLKGTGKRSSDETKVHIIIDELMVIMLDKENRIASKYLQGLLAMARAANIQIILATQCPKATVIPTEIKANCGIIIGLQTRNAQDSRNILDENGCENLPRHGKALVQDPDHQNTYMVDLKMVNEKHIKELVDWRLAGN